MVEVGACVVVVASGVMVVSISVVVVVSGDVDVVGTCDVADASIVVVTMSGFGMGSEVVVVVFAVVVV